MQLQVSPLERGRERFQTEEKENNVIEAVRERKY